MDQEINPPASITEATPSNFRYKKMSDGSTVLQGGHKTYSAEGVSVEWIDIPVVEE